VLAWVGINGIGLFSYICVEAAVFAGRGNALFILALLLVLYVTVCSFVMTCCYSKLINHYPTQWWIVYGTMLGSNILATIFLFSKSGSTDFWPDDLGFVIGSGVYSTVVCGYLLIILGLIKWCKPFPDNDGYDQHQYEHHQYEVVA